MTTGNSRRRLGTIVEVTAETFRVELSETANGYTLVGFDGQHYVARIGTLVLIPLTNSYVVAEVSGLKEHPDLSAISSASKSLDDVFHGSSRQLTISPLGTLPFDESKGFSFGVSEFPPLFADVLHVENRDLDRVLNVADQEVAIGGSSPLATRLNSLTVGTSVVFSDYDVKVRINEFFGAHSAILGNTGSGKSCTISSFLQESLGKADLAPAAGSTFIIFDTNGEYRQAVSKLPKPIERTYAKVNQTKGSQDEIQSDTREKTVDFKLPHWLLTLEEWELLVQASSLVQKPVLHTALGLTSLFAEEFAEELTQLRDHILASSLLHLLMDSDNATAAKSRITGLLNVYELQSISNTELIKRLALWYGDFTNENVRWMQNALKNLLMASPEIPSYQNHPFHFSDLKTALELAILYEESHGNRRVRDNCASLLTRVKSLENREEFRFLRGDRNQVDAKTADTKIFVDTLLGIDYSDEEPTKRSQVYILDLSSVSDEIVEVVSSVITRLVFEQLRQSRPRNNYPVNLILEEAHRYVPRQVNAASTLEATQIFERVAKEGRKYGLFLMLSSQRPSELSGTVLSQCSNYVIHRIQNPEDLQHIRRMTPFISESVLNRLASLPKQHALVFGTSVSIPMTFIVRTADPLPQSDDSDVSAHWYQTPENVQIARL